MNHKQPLTWHYRSVSDKENTRSHKSWRRNTTWGQIFNTMMIIKRPANKTHCERCYRRIMGIFRLFIGRRCIKSSRAGGRTDSAPPSSSSLVGEGGSFIRVQGVEKERCSNTTQMRWTCWRREENRRTEQPLPPPPKQAQRVASFLRLARPGDGLMNISI